jgi:hypothetical protein
MIEIAIALGVIGFALVAIMGILPAGLEVQRDNRSETIISEDGTFWIEAIRNGSFGMDDLTNYVEEIVTPERTFTYGNGGLGADQFHYGSNIIGLLTSALDKGSNRVDAIVTAFSGSAVEKDYNQNEREVSLKYKLSVQITNALSTAIPFSVIAQATEQLRLETLYEVRVTLAYPYLRADREPARRKSFRASVSRTMQLNVIDGVTNCFFLP